MSQQDVQLPTHTVIGKHCNIEVIDKESPEISLREIAASQVVIDLQLIASANAAQQSSKHESDKIPLTGDGPEWLSKVALPNLGPVLTQKLVNVLKRNHISFAKHEEDMGRTSTIKQRIYTKDEIPVRQAYQRIPPHLYDEFREHLNDLVRRGIIVKSISEYASPIVVARKKNGMMRLCVDYRRINQKMVGDSFPLSRIDDCFEN